MLAPIVSVSVALAVMVAVTLGVASVLEGVFVAVGVGDAERVREMVIVPVLAGVPVATGVQEGLAPAESVGVRLPEMERDTEDEGVLSGVLLLTGVLVCVLVKEGVCVAVAVRVTDGVVDGGSVWLQEDVGVAGADADEELVGVLGGVALADAVL